jgi:hypothetical protein
MPLEKKNTTASSPRPPATPTQTERLQAFLVNYLDPDTDELKYMKQLVRLGWGIEAGRALVRAQAATAAARARRQGRQDAPARALSARTLAAKRA